MRVVPILTNLCFIQVNLNCWNETAEIKEHLQKENKAGTEKEFLDLWGQFQARALDLAVQANRNEVLFTNKLFSYSKHLSMIVVAQISPRHLNEKF